MTMHQLCQFCFFIASFENMSTLPNFAELCPTMHFPHTLYYERQSDQWCQQQKGFRNSSFWESRNKKEKDHTHVEKEWHSRKRTCCRSLNTQILAILLKYKFCKKSLWKNATLNCWTLSSSQKGTCRNRS